MMLAKTAYVILLLGTAVFVNAQTSATITGVVRDASNSMIPGVLLQLTNVDQNRPWTAHSNQVGAYTFQQIPPGNYRLDVEATGFKKFTRGGLILNVAQVAEINISLEVGSVTETVEVRAETPLLETASSALGEVVNEVTMENLPLNGRNVMQLVGLTPGINTTANYRDATSGSGSINSVVFSANGGRNVSNQVLLDGTAQEVMGYNQPAFIPSPDAVQEFRVQTNSMSAEYGRTGGAVINLVHRSGTRAFHGTLYEFLRNEAFDANGFFRNRNGESKSGFRYNQFGFTVGGPMTPSRERAFFFLNYEGLRVRNAGGSYYTVPTARMRAGDFSELLDPVLNNQIIEPVYDPLTTNADGRRQPFAGNVVPKGRQHPVALKMLENYPLPGIGGTTFNNYFATAGSRNTSDTFTSRFDYRVADNHNLYGRFSWNDQNTVPGDDFGTPGSPTKGWNGGRSRGVTLDDTVVTRGWILHGNAGIAYHANPRNTPDYKGVTETLGLPSYINAVRLREIFPLVQPAGYSQLGVVAAHIIDNRFYNLIFSGDASRLIGNHTLKVGGQYRLNRISNFRPQNPGGTYNFNVNWTREYFNRGQGGDSIASLLLGLPGGGLIRSDPSLSCQVPYSAAFVQDDWRVNSRLTVNAGLRWERDGALTEKWDRASWWDPTTKLPLEVKGMGPFYGGVVFAGRYNEFGDKTRGTADMPWTNFAPRLGLAYKVTDKLVVRSGFGIMFAPTTGFGFNANTAGALSFNASTSIPTSIDAGRTPYATLSNPWPDGFIRPENGALGVMTLAGDSIETRFRNREMPYSAQWNFDIQYALPANMLIDVAYAGSAGVHLLAGASQLNQLPDEYLNLGDGLNTVVANPFYGILPAVSGMGKTTTTRSQMLRPSPWLTGLNDIWSRLAHSSYHALQTKFRKRYSNGLQFLMAYTWSKSIDDISSVAAYGHQNPGYTNHYNRRLDKSISGVDLAHVLTFNYQWDLPFGKGKRYLNEGGVAQYLAGGWVLNGVTTYQSGLPISINSRTNTLYNFGGTQRPDMTGLDANAEGSIRQRIDGWINRAAFVDVKPYTYGNTGRFVPGLRAPAYANWDISILKNFPVTERVRVQFRAELFNALNNVNFNAPSGVVFGNNDFGFITGAESARIIQFGLKLYF